VYIPPDPTYNSGAVVVPHACPPGRRGGNGPPDRRRRWGSSDRRIQAAEPIRYQGPWRRDSVGRE
jgi:hypothetical protein